jgi:hypothetical protein
MVYSYLYLFDPMTATRPLEDDQPLGAVSSHRVIFNAAAPPARPRAATALAVPFPRAPIQPGVASGPRLREWSSFPDPCRGV